MTNAADSVHHKFRSILSGFKTFLSHKTVSYLILFLSLIGRTIQVIFFYNIRVDRSFQLMAMQNFVKGHGVAISNVIPSDLSAVIYEPLIKWPPGYSLLVAPFYLLFNNNYLISTLMIDILFGIIFILTCRRILKELQVPVHLVNFFTLLSGFFLYDFYIITSTDGIATTVFLLAIYFGILILNREKNRLKNAVFLSLCLLTCGFLKYLLIPAIFVVPIFLFAYGFLNKDRILKMAAVLVFLLSALGIAGLLLYQKHVSSSSVYISEPHRGFFPENLFAFYPFLPASFIKPSTFELMPWLNGHIVNLIFQLVHPVLLIFILSIFSRSMLKNKFKNLSPAQVLTYLCFSIISAIVLVLVILSVRVQKEEPFLNVFWTYVQEPRYYGLVLVLIQLLIVIRYRYWNTNSLRRYIFLFLLSCFAIETIHGFYFDFRRIALLNKEEYSWQYEYRFQKYADSVLKNELKKYPAKKTVITGSSYYMNHRISIYCHVPIMGNVQSINQLSSLKAKEPVLLLIILDKKYLSSYRPFLLSYREIAGQFNDFYFYIVYVQPH